MDPIRVILRTASGGPLQAQIVSGIPSSGREQILRLWRPFIQACKEDDAGWAWRWILEPTDGMIELALLTEGRIEGVMKVRLTSICREFENLGAPCCLIEYAAVAPWNRPADTVAWTATGKAVHEECGNERATPCGRLLFAAAMRLSRERGYEGRLGWFSERGAEARYREWFPEISRVRIPMKPAGYSDLKPATHSDLKAATIPI